MKFSLFTAIVFLICLLIDRSVWFLWKTSLFGFGIPLKQRTDHLKWCFGPIKLVYLLVLGIIKWTGSGSWKCLKLSEANGLLWKDTHLWVCWGTLLLCCLLLIQSIIASPFHVPFAYWNWKCLEKKQFSALTMRYKETEKPNMIFMSPYWLVKICICFHLVW